MFGKINGKSLESYYKIYKCFDIAGSIFLIMQFISKLYFNIKWIDIIFVSLFYILSISMFFYMLSVYGKEYNEAQNRISIELLKKLKFFQLWKETIGKTIAFSSIVITNTVSNNKDLFQEEFWIMLIMMTLASILEGYLIINKLENKKYYIIVSLPLLALSLCLLPEVLVFTTFISIVVGYFVIYKNNPVSFLLFTLVLSLFLPLFTILATNYDLGAKIAFVIQILFLIILFWNYLKDKQSRKKNKK